MSESHLVSIVMGSDSDLEIMNEAAKALDDFGIAYEIDVTSAHRSPARTSEYARSAAGRARRARRSHRRKSGFNDGQILASNLGCPSSSG